MVGRCSLFARAAGLALALGLAGMPAQAQAAAERSPVTIRHLLWDSNQRPLYQACAKDFEAAHPTIRVRIQQLGWDDYWTSLSTGFISGTAPDVFTTHLMRQGEFVGNGVLKDLAPLIARDRVDTSIYEAGLLDNWSHDGRQLAMPIDWDTVALAVNLDHAAAVGLGLDELRRLDWNPRDGGSFGRALVRLTRDSQGRSPAEPGFDARSVRIHGYLNPGAGGMFGQTEWSHFAASAGWRFQARPWDPALRYDDPVLIDTLAWLASLPGRGVTPAPGSLGKLGADAAFMAGRVAMVPSGAWMVGHFQRQVRFRYAWLPLPIGPSGQRASMRNGLALSIWSGSRQPEAAWQWVRYVGSAACQSQVARAGIVYPAIRGLAEVALAAQRDRGVDASVFLEASRGITYPPPLVSHGAEVNDLMTSALERILAGRAPAADTLKATARQVRQITSAP